MLLVSILLEWMLVWMLLVWMLLVWMLRRGLATTTLGGGMERAVGGSGRLVVAAPEIPAQVKRAEPTRPQRPLLPVQSVKQFELCRVVAYIACRRAVLARALGQHQSGRQSNLALQHHVRGKPGCVTAKV
jgi:hypothetical protein